MFKVFMEKREKNVGGKLRILAAGDLHGDLDIAKKLAKKAKSKKVDLVVLAGDIHGFQEGDEKILEPFKKVDKKVVFVPGNWDSSLEVDLLKKSSRNIEDYYVTYNGVGIVGLGNKDFDFSVDKNKFEIVKKNFEKMKPPKKILVSHLHASGSKAEFSGIPGDEMIRKAVDYFQPDFLISAHIHEAEGIEEKIGKTKVVQVGRRGKVLEV